MRHKVKKCRACGAVVQSGDAKCAGCHSNITKHKSGFFGKKKKELLAFFDRLLDIRIKSK